MSEKCKVSTIILDTPLGKVQAASCNDSLCGLWFIGQKYFPEDTAGWQQEPGLPVFTALKSWLEDYFAGKQPKVKIPLCLCGSDFQKAVWKLISEIPYGKTTSYGAMTSQLVSRGIKASAQAVGGAVGRNPISLIIPCHRVLGSDGSLTGYAGGIEKKRALLELEKGK